MNRIDAKASPGQNYSASSSSSSAGPQFAPLSSFEIDTVEERRLDHITASLFFHYFEPEDPELDAHFPEPLIDELKSWFSEYKVGHGLTWIDLLGLRCYDILKQLSTERMVGSEMKEILNRWSAVYLVELISLLAPASLADQGGKFFFSQQRFKDELKKTALSVNTLCSKSISKIPLNRSMAKFPRIMNEKKREFEDLQAKWQKVSELFQKFLELPNPRSFLCDSTVSGCANAILLTPKTLEERKTALQNFIMSMDMHETCITEARKRGAAGLILPFQGMAKSLQDLHFAFSSEEMLVIRSRDFCERLYHFRKVAKASFRSFERELAQAKAGELTHEQWCAYYGTPKKAQLASHSQFIEQLTYNFTLAAFYFALSFDYQSILQCCILQSAETDARTRHMRVRTIFKQLLESEDSSGLDYKRQEVQKEIQQYSELPTFKLLMEDSLPSHNSLAIFEAENMHQFYLSLKGSVNHFLESAINLEEREFQPELEFFAKVFVLVHDLEILTEKGGLVVGKESEIFPDEFIKLFESQNRLETLSDEEEEHDLASVDLLPKMTPLNLSGSPTLKKPDNRMNVKDQAQPTQVRFHSGSLSLVPPCLPTESSTILTPPLDAATLAKTASNSLRDRAVDEVKRSKPVLKHPKKNRKAQKTVEVTQSKPVVVDSKKEMKSEKSTFDESTKQGLNDILEEKKRRKVERILRSLGLEPLSRKQRGKGDHTVWRDPEHRLGQTVVPAHGELAEGTRRSMVEQLLQGNYEP